MESKKETGTNFECTICLDTAKEPVLTKCGHMFCWPCIYNWLDSKNGRAKCPNCKNIITKDDLIPVYANDENRDNTNRFKNIPKRPKAERNPNSDREDNDSQNFFNFSFGSFGLGGFFPFMGMNFNKLLNKIYITTNYILFKEVLMLNIKMNIIIIKDNLNFYKEFLKIPNKLLLI